MESEITLQGRRIQLADLAWLQGWIEENPGWSRKEIARELCRRWDWVDGRGRLKDFAARSLLLKLEGRGQVKLPALRTQFRRVRPKVAWLEQWEQPPGWTASLAEIGPVRLQKDHPDLFAQVPAKVWQRHWNVDNRFRPRFQSTASE